MFGTLGGPEVLLLLVLALIVFGPRKLPEIGKSVGKMLVEIRRAGNDFKRTVEDEVESERVRDTKPLLAAADPAPPGPGAEPASAPSTSPDPAVEPQETTPRS